MSSHPHQEPTPTNPLPNSLSEPADPSFEADDPRGDDNGETTTVVDPENIPKGDRPQG